MGLSHYLSRYRVDISEEELLRLRRAIHSVLLGIDRANAIQLADMLAALPYPLAFAYLELLQPVLYSLGDEWAAGAITPMRVQIASSLANSMLATLYHRRVNGTPLTNPAIVVCAAAGNLHELGSRMVADLLEEAHYQTIVIAPPRLYATCCWNLSKNITPPCWRSPRHFPSTLPKSALPRWNCGGMDIWD